VGVGVRTLATLDPAFPGRLDAALRVFRPHLVHALHARKGGAAYLDRALAGDPPLVVSLTGTEIHRDLSDPERASRVLETLRRARLVLSHGRSLLAAATAVLPSLADRAAVVPKGVLLPPLVRGFDLRRAAGLGGDALVFLLPSGLREVKDPLFALAPLARLRGRDPRVAFVHAGETIESGVAEALAAAARREPWIRTLGAVPFARMRSVYEGADVVLNTSRSEGLANSILEAQAAGRAVLASDVAANREVVRPGRTGLLYGTGDGESFLRAAARLAGDAALRRRLGAAARRAVLPANSPAAEARAVRDAYLRVLTI
jgi:glycosyltransferase involved in cell wall biosynthesis